MANLYAFTKDEIERLFNFLKPKYALLSPQPDEMGVIQWQPARDISIDFYGNTFLPLKHYFFPQFEKLFAFKGRKGRVEILPMAEKISETVFWGVRPCDIKSIELLDKVFLAHEFVDPQYKEKRDKTLFITFDCLEPYDTCFCTSLGYSPMEDAISAVQFFKLAESQYLATLTPAGQDLLKQAGLKQKAATPEQLEALNSRFEALKKDFSIQFQLGEKKSDLKAFFQDPYFEEMAQKCLGCGICSFVCPTCHCFTLEDTTRQNDGHRIRCWDYCLNPDFTQMAGGHNPRTTQAARIRQRFLHKGFYFDERDQLLGCVGCGRCLMKCPASMDICEALIHIRGGQKR